MNRKKNGYYFRVRDDKTLWMVKLSGRKRLMGHGNPFKDKYFTKFIDKFDEGKLDEFLRPLMRKHRLYSEFRVLMDCTDSGFQFVKGAAAHTIEFFESLTQDFIDFYRCKYSTTFPQSDKHANNSDEV